MRKTAPKLTVGFTIPSGQVTKSEIPKSILRGNFEDWSNAFSMGLIQGARVDLVTPFPSDELRLVYEWAHACSECTETDDSPGSAEAYESEMGIELIRCTSYGLLRAGGSDGWIGLLYCEPSGPRNAYLHITMPRHAWGHGLADEAMALAIQDLFGRFPELTRLSAAMIENNWPAQALALRMCFRREATFPDMVVQGGIPRSMVHYGLTRKEWEQNGRSEDEAIRRMT